MAHWETKQPSHAPFYESRNITSPQRRTLGSPAGRLCKIIDIFHDGTHGVSPGTDGSNPSPSSGESGANSISLGLPLTALLGPNAIAAAPDLPQSAGIAATRHGHAGMFAAFIVALSIAAAGEPFPYRDIWDPLGRIFDAFSLDRCL